MKTLLIEVSVLLIVGVLSVVEGIRLVLAEKLQMYDVLGPGLYNVGMGSILIIIGLIYFVSERKKIVPIRIRKRSETQEPVRSTENMGYKKMMISMILAMIAYILLMDWIGYLFSSLVFFFLINRIVGFRSWLGSLGLTATMTISFYLIFVVWMKMIFPRGVLLNF